MKQIERVISDKEKILVFLKELNGRKNVTETKTGCIVNNSEEWIFNYRKELVEIKLIGEKSEP